MRWFLPNAANESQLKSWRAYSIFCFAFRC